MKSNIFFQWDVTLIDVNDNKVISSVPDMSCQRQIDEALRSYGMVSAVGSLHLLSQNQTVAVKEVPVVIDGRAHKLQLAEKSHHVIIDEIHFGPNENGNVVKARVGGDDIRLLTTALDTLNLAVEGEDEEAPLRVLESRGRKAQQCCGIALSITRQCCNRTLISYRAHSGSSWIPLCWRHKQQVLDCYRNQSVGDASNSVI